MKTIKSFDAIENPREIRKKLGMNQQEFWGQIGVTQSGGSRYLFPEEACLPYFRG